MNDWAHSPLHRFRQGGTYMLTAGTYLKRPYFRGTERLRFLCETLQNVASQHGWELEAWAVFPNHYHFIGSCPASASKAETNASTMALDGMLKNKPLAAFLKHLHSVTAIQANKWDQTPGRQTWFQYWDSELTIQESYLARMNYVHTNAVHHGLVLEPSLYPLCSAGWFQRNATAASYKTIMRMKTDRLKIMDDFSVDLADI